MSGILLDQPAPGATTCLVIGALRSSAGRDWQRYRAIQWWIDPTVSDTLPAGFPRDRTQIAQVNTGDIAAILERFVRLDPRHLPSLIIADSIGGAHAGAYQNLITEAHRLFESTHRTRFTRQQDGFSWQKNILKNADGYARHRLPASWAGALRGLPAFVCGAGPSLDVSLPKLAGVAPGAVIFSADSALRALARHQLKADFAVSIDIAKVPEKCLPADCGFSPDRVVLASVSPPAWQEAISAERRFFLSANQLTDDWFAAHGVSRTAVSVVDSCGSTAIELARHLGCDPIYLFGLDLAVDPANQARRHQSDADPALYAKSHYDPTAQLPRVPGNYAETVPCFALGDWRELDARLASRTEGKVFNVNDRGARLRGATLVHPEQFSFSAPSVSKEARLATLVPESVSPTPTVSALRQLQAIGTRCTQALPALRRALAGAGPAAVAEGFRPLLLDPEIGRGLGAFALKLMPHLVPPIEGDRASWQTLLEEFAELAQLARDVAVD